MELRPNLSAQIKQSLTMTPGLIQSIRLLTFNQEDLCAFLREQEEKNPLIEISGLEYGEAEQAPQDSAPEKEATALIAGHHATAAVASHGLSSSSNDSFPSVEDLQVSVTTLREHLLSQVNLVVDDPVARLVAAELVEAMNKDGYLNDNDLLFIADDLELPHEFIEDVLSRVQTLEPIGVGARSLSECLALQLKHRGEYTAELGILLDHLELVASLKFEELARLCSVSRKDVMHMVSVIRTLNPHPGAEFDHEVSLPTLPDLNLQVSAEGDFHIELNSEMLPKVLVHKDYYSKISRGTTDAEETRFVTDCLQSANWLVRNLDQRANTILKVATEIVRQQKDFFLGSDNTLKPMRQRDVADLIGVHRSTVCRATAGKYIMTNRGMYELSYFFSNGIGDTEGAEAHSSEAIREQIRRLVSREESEAIYSDDAIANILKQRGIDIARRTVAKYREMMNIPSSQIRKRQQKIAAAALAY